MKVKDFLYSNWAYLLWAGVYMFLSWVLFTGAFSPSEAIVYTIVIYAVSIGIALSPVGEIMLRISMGVRKPATREEIDYLLPIFEEVYQSAIEENPGLNQQIQIFMDDSMVVNAYAIGRKTVTVTKGALQTFSPEELRGVLSHELGHIAHGDTKAILLNTIGNGFFSICILIANLVIRITQTALNFSKFWWINLIINFVLFFANIYILIFQLVGDLILSLNSRQAEYFADKFAYQVGYGHDLASALYILQQIEIPAGVPILERLRASHPHTAKRIQRLEEMEMEY